MMIIIMITTTTTIIIRITILYITGMAILVHVAFQNMKKFINDNKDELIVYGIMLVNVFKEAQNNCS